MSDAPKALPPVGGVNRNTSAWLVGSVPVDGHPEPVTVNDSPGWRVTENVSIANGADAAATAPAWSRTAARTTTMTARNPARIRAHDQLRSPCESSIAPAAAITLGRWRTAVRVWAQMARQQEPPPKSARHQIDAILARTQRA